MQIVHLLTGTQPSLDPCVIHSPEVLKNIHHREFGFDDIYSLGVIMTEIVIGRPLKHEDSELGAFRVLRPLVPGVTLCFRDRYF